jgi:hypothetical protein
MIFIELFQQINNSFRNDISTRLQFYDDIDSIKLLIQDSARNVTYVEDRLVYMKTITSNPN